MKLLRYIPGVNLLRQPTDTEHTARRKADAERMAEHHRQRAVEMGDHAVWAAAQKSHHERMASVYGDRVDSRRVDDMYWKKLKQEGIQS